jgi:hypothetical protein
MNLLNLQVPEDGTAALGYYYPGLCEYNMKREKFI